MSGVPRGDWAALKPCGTTAAYRRHLRHGERPCEHCRQAEARLHQERWRGGYDQVRRDRYATARAAGKNSRDAARYASSPLKYPLEVAS